MAAADQSAVKAILEEFHIRLRQVVDQAWEELRAFPSGKLVFPARARAVLMFDYIARKALEEFAGDPNIRVIVKNQTVQFLFKNQVLLRFKKGNPNGVGSNISTQAVLDFIDPNRVIPGLLPDLFKVECCYAPDRLGIGLQEVAVVARNRTARIWAYTLDRPAEAGGVVPLPTRAPDGTPPAVLPRQRRIGEEANAKG